jgi:hypothetical protein
MRCPAAALVLVAVVSSGCQTRRGSVKWTVAGLGMSAAGTLLAYSLWDEEAEVPTPIAATVLVLMFGGGLTALSSGLNAIFGFTGPVFEDPPRPTPAQIADRQRDDARARAWTLTKQAAHAARSGDCALAVAADVAVHELDAEFHAIVFRRDVAIARCLH